MENIPNTTDVINNFICGSLWKEKSVPFLEKGKAVLPFFLYIDDSEVNNPLSSHTNPVTFVYYSFPVMKNSEIYLAATLQGRDYKEFGNRQCLNKLVDEIKDLEENVVSIRTSEGQKTVYFVLGLILGDNLGLNTILGFTPSFNHNFFCRFCKSHKKSTHKMQSEDLNVHRNRVGYNADVQLDDVQSTVIK